MKKPFLHAMQGTYRSKEQADHIRITGEGCITLSDVPLLKSARTFAFEVIGLDDQKRDFVKLNLDGVDLLADVITGTVYRASDGVCLSGMLRLKVNQ